MPDDYNSDAEREIALSNTRHLEHLRGFIREVFSLPTVAEAVYDVEAREMFDEIERWMNQEATNG